MSKNKEICTIDIQDSKFIKIGNIQSDADKVLKLRNVEGLTTGDIFHFTKSEKEVDQIFEIIIKMIETSSVETDVKNRALELSQSVKTSYLSKSTTGFKASYLHLAGFLSDHISLATFITPMLQNLVA